MKIFLCFDKTSYLIGHFVNIESENENNNKNFPYEKRDVIDL